MRAGGGRDAAAARRRVRRRQQWKEQRRWKVVVVAAADVAGGIWWGVLGVLAARHGRAHYKHASTAQRLWGMEVDREGMRAGAMHGARRLAATVVY